MADTDETIAERLGIPDRIEFRGYEYTMHSIHRPDCFLPHSDIVEDNARIEAGHIRYDGWRACVKQHDEWTWVVYWR